ncbi:MAG TPA: tetratricopeptide repeat protein, partial [Clostridia bacterium]
RILAAVVVVALAGLAVFGLVQLGIGLVRNIQPAPPSDSAKLFWILGRLEDTANSGNAGADSVAALIREYREKYGSAENPTVTPAVTSRPSASTAPAASTAATSAFPPTPTATPIPSTVPDYTQTVATANSLLTDAKGRMAAQPIEALRLLDALADMLQDVPGDARSPGVTSSASEMLAARANLIAINLWHLSESHRIAAEAPWLKKDYAACLPLYEAIYRINPEYYTGYCAYRLGVCYEQVGALEQALACYRTVEKIGTKSPQYAGALARIQAIG